jgi:hypothetical protein
MRVKSILNQVEKYKDFVYERGHGQRDGQERVRGVEVRARAAIVDADEWPREGDIARQEY